MGIWIVVIISLLWKFPLGTFIDKCLWGYIFSFSLGRYQEAKLLGYMFNLCLTFPHTANFSKVVRATSHSHQAMYESSHFSTSTLVITICFLIIGILYGCLVVSHCILIYFALMIKIFEYLCMCLFLTVESFSIFCCREYNQSDFSVDHLVMSMCRVFSCVVGRGCLLWPVHFLGKTLLVFALLHSTFQGQICLLLQVLLDSLLLLSSPL